MNGQYKQSNNRYSNLIWCLRTAIVILSLPLFFKSGIPVVSKNNIRVPQTQQGKCDGGLKMSDAYTFDLDNSGGDNIIGKVLGSPKNILIPDMLLYEYTGGYFVSKRDVEDQKPGEWGQAAFITPSIVLKYQLSPHKNSYRRELIIGGDYIENVAEICYEIDPKGYITRVYVRK